MTEPGKVTYWKATDGFYAVYLDGEVIGHVHREGYGRDVRWHAHDDDCRGMGIELTRRDATRWLTGEIRRA